MKMNVRASLGVVVCLVIVLASFAHLQGAVLRGQLGDGARGGTPPTWGTLTSPDGDPDEYVFNHFDVGGPDSLDIQCVEPIQTGPTQRAASKAGAAGVFGKIVKLLVLAKL